jgi:CTP-dependent riboflavin kinase
MAYGSDYEKATTEYRKLAKAALEGDKVAHKEKAQAMLAIRKIEREAARAGTLLSIENRGDRVVAKEQATSSKRSMQEEYVRKFDDKTEQTINGEKTTIAGWHRKRLLGR